MKNAVIEEKVINKKNRITYIDTAKCISILLVLLGHILIIYRGMGNPHPRLLIFIYTFHMPAFFIFSGILFNNKKWLQSSSLKFIVSRIKSLLIPYLFLDIICGIIMSIISHSFSCKILFEIVKKTFSFSPNVGPDWFLPTMFISSIIFYFFIKYYKNWFKYIAFIPILLLEFDIFTSNNLLIFIFRGIIGFTFIYIGYTFKKYFLDDYNKRCDILVVALAALIAIMNENGQIEMSTGYISNPILTIAGGMVGTFLLIGISKHIDNRFFNFIGKNTIVFMVTHFILIVPLHNLFKFHNGNYSILILFLIILIIEIPIMYIYDKLFSRLVGKKKFKN